MGWIIIIAIIIGVAVLVRQGKLDLAPKEIKELYRGRTPEQKEVIRYFKGGGCFAETLSDQKYDGMVRDRATSSDWKAKALSKIGLEESQVNEIPPVHFEGYDFDTNSMARPGKVDKKWRSSAYQITWIFFSASQIYVWQYTFNMDSDRKNEATEEYFYKDITNFSAASETIEKDVWDKYSCKGEPVYIHKTVDFNRFAIVVPGDKFYCSMEQTDYTEQSIQGMKTMLRDKKEQR